MDIFTQLEQIDQMIEEAEERKKQEELFQNKKENAMEFLVKDMLWEEIEMEKAQKAEKEKLQPLSFGFGPWSW